MNLKERLKIFIEYNRLSIREFERQCGLNRGNISNLSESIGTDKIVKIIERYPNLNTDWLLTGKGSMLEKPDSNPPGNGYRLAAEDLQKIVKAQSSKAMLKLLVDGKIFTKKMMEAKDKIIQQQEETINQLKQRITMLENEKAITSLHKKLPKTFKKN